MPFLTQGNTNWKFIGIVVVLAIIVGLGVWFLSDLEQETPIISEEELTEDIEEETADWQTYRNEELGIEFKYPSDFFIQEREIIPMPEEEIVDTERYEYSKPVELLYYIEAYSEDTSQRDIDMGRADIHIDVRNNTNNLAINDWLDYINKGAETGLIYECSSITHRKPTSILGIEAVRGFTGCGTICLEGIWIPKGDKVYNLSQRGYVRGVGECPEDHHEINNTCCVKYDHIFNQILSTFRFIEIDETPDLSSKDLVTVDWQTYRNKEVEFEVKYPPDWKISREGSFFTSFLPQEIENEFYACISIRFDKLYAVNIVEHLKRAGDIYALSKAQCLEEKKYTLVDIEGQEGYRCEDLPEPFPSIATLTETDRFIYHFHAVDTEICRNFNTENIYDQILSTFRFLE